MKKSHRAGYVVVVCALAAIMVAGCATSAGTVKMRRETVDWQQEKVMAQRSLERFNDGNFYVYEWRRGIPAAVVAELKDTDRTIKAGPGWRKINTRQELEEVYQSGGAIKAKAGMKLYRIEGEDGEIWGYFFAPGNVLPYSVIDDKTIELGRIPEPKAPGP